MVIIISKGIGIMISFYLLFRRDLKSFTGGIFLMYNIKSSWMQRNKKIFQMERNSKPYLWTNERQWPYIIIRQCQRKHLRLRINMDKVKEVKDKHQIHQQNCHLPKILEFKMNNNTKCPLTLKVCLLLHFYLFIYNENHILQCQQPPKA